MKILFKLSHSLQQRQQEKARWIFPVELSMYATYLRNQGQGVVWDGKDDGGFDKIISSEDQIDVPFLDLPAADRNLTRGMDKKWQNNGNFKYNPGTYTLAASGCWYGKCGFCAEKNKKYEVRKVGLVLHEMAGCYEQGFKEIFDDSGTFPDGDWLREFCNRKIIAGIDIPISCNMRIGADVDFELMKRVGFRMVLFGIESGSQKVLDRINKGTKVEDIIPTIKAAAKAGLEPHIAGMVGMPFETEEDSIKTIKLFKYLMLHGYAKTSQMSLYKSEYCSPNESARKYLNKHMSVIFNPLFWWNKIKDIKSSADLSYFIKQINEGVRIFKERKVQ